MTTKSLSISNKTGWFSRVRKQLGLWILLFPVVFGILMFKIYPIFSAVILSFFHTTGFKATQFCGFDNYKAVLTDTLFLKTVANSWMYVFWSLVIGFLPSLIFAIMLNEVVHFKETFKFITYLPAVTPALAVSLLWGNMFSADPGGFLNIILSKFGAAPQQWLANPDMAIPLIVVSMTWSGYAGSMLLYLSALQGISQDLYEAALIDGAGIWKRIFKITIPRLAPMMLLLAVRQVIALFQIMEQPLVMTDGGPNNATMTVNLASYKMAFSYMQVDRSLALGVVAFLMLLVFTIIYFYLDKRLSE